MKKLLFIVLLVGQLFGGNTVVNTVVNGVVSHYFSEFNLFYGFHKSDVNTEVELAKNDVNRMMNHLINKGYITEHTSIKKVRFYVAHSLYLYLKRAYKTSWEFRLLVDMNKEQASENSVLIAMYL